MLDYYFFGIEDASSIYFDLTRPPTEHPHKLPNLIVKEPPDLHLAETVNLSPTTSRRQLLLADRPAKTSALPRFNQSEPRILRTISRRSTAYRTNFLFERYARKAAFADLVDGRPAGRTDQSPVLYPLTIDSHRPLFDHAQRIGGTGHQPRCFQYVCNGHAVGTRGD